MGLSDSGINNQGISYPKRLSHYKNAITIRETDPTTYIPSWTNIGFLNVDKSVQVRSFHFLLTEKAFTYFGTLIKRSNDVSTLLFSTIVNILTLHNDADVWSMSGTRYTLQACPEHYRPQSWLKKLIKSSIS